MKSACVGVLSIRILVCFAGYLTPLYQLHTRK